MQIIVAYSLLIEHGKYVLIAVGVGFVLRMLDFFLSSRVMLWTIYVLFFYSIAIGVPAWSSPSSNTSLFDLAAAPVIFGALFGYGLCNLFTWLRGTLVDHVEKR